MSENPIDSSAPPTQSRTLRFSFLPFSTLLSLKAAMRSSSMTSEQLEMSMMPMLRCVHKSGLMFLIFSVDWLSVNFRFGPLKRGVV